MPPRIVAAGIIFFWLATTGFIVHRDLWPRLFASGPPPVSIELADEARQSNVPAKWTIYRNGQQVGRLQTHLKYLDAEDAFQFTYHYSELKLEQAEVTLVSSEAVSEMKINRAGDLKEQTMKGKVKLLYRGQGIVQGTIHVQGRVTNGILTGRAELQSDLGNLAGDLDPLTVPHGQPFNPLQPVNRFGHLRGNQDWRIRESNPLEDAVFELLKKKTAEVGVRLPGGKEKEWLYARVSDTPQTLARKKEDVSCWVIEYRRTEVVARTWVQASDGKVLRQEASEKGENLVFERED